MWLTWYIAGELSERDVKGPDRGMIYRLDRDYFPKRVFMACRGLTTGVPLIIDINDDGTSIFTDGVRASVSPVRGTSETTHFGTAKTRILKDSLITLDVDQVSPISSGRELTVQLELEPASSL